MNRRDTVRALLALATVAGPFARNAQGQQREPVRRIGYLILDAAPVPRLTPEQWRQRPLSMALRTLGWDEGRNLIIERAHADLKIDMLPQLAAELVRKRVEVIVTSGPEATVVAARATKTIPIVFFNVVWPQEQGLIESFARPGRNVTGVTFYSGVEVSTKRMELLREVAPAAKRLSWLWPPDYQETVAGARFDMTPAFQAAAKALGFELRLHAIRRSEDIDTAFAEILAWRAQAMMASSEYVHRALERVVGFALSRRLPSAFPGPEFVEAGGLMSYGAGRDELRSLFFRSAEYVDRILRGALPGALPVEQPKRYELTINLPTAKALALTIPQSVLLRADRVIR